MKLFGLILLSIVVLSVSLLLATPPLPVEEATDLVRDHFDVTPHWWRDHGRCVFLTAHGRVNEKLLRRMEQDLTDYLHRQYRHLPELLAAELVTLTTGTAVKGRIHYATWTLALTDKLRDHTPLRETDDGWYVATHATRELVRVDRISGIWGVPPESGATLHCTVRYRVTDFGRSMGLADLEESVVLRAFRSGAEWRIDEQPLKSF